MGWKENGKYIKKSVVGHSHAHSFEEVVSALYSSPESFSIAKDEEQYYSKQELEYLRRVQKYLLFIGMKDLEKQKVPVSRYRNKIHSKVIKNATEKKKKTEEQSKVSEKKPAKNNSKSTTTPSSKPSNNITNNNTATSPKYRQDISNSFANQINIYRKENGLSVLPNTSETQSEADRRSKEISINYSHDGAGYGFGENIGYGGIGSDFITAWKNSPSHNATMLREQNVAMAVSVYEVNGMWYAVTSFKMNY